MTGRTAYHPEITDLVHTGLTDAEYDTHMQLGWSPTPRSEQQVAAAAQIAPEPQPQPVPVVVVDPTPETETAPTPDPVRTPEPTPEQAPAGNASLEDWQAYAISKGATPEDIDGKKRDELRELYA